jgi:hypothetical protein
MSTRTATIDGRRMTLARPDGVASSIERHAAATVTTSLAAPAIERRQPAVRGRAESPPRTTESRTDTPRRQARPAISSRLRSPAADGANRRQSLPVTFQSETRGGGTQMTGSLRSGGSHEPRHGARHLGPTRDMLGTSIGTTPMVRPSASSHASRRTRASRPAEKRPDATGRASAAPSARAAPKPSTMRRQVSSSRAAHEGEAAKPRRDVRARSTSRGEPPRHESDPTPSRRQRR